MCGIFCSVFNTSGRPTNEMDCETLFFQHCSKSRIKHYLSCRGPDVCQDVDKQLTKSWICEVIGSTLWTQGKRPTSQPLQDSKNNFLLWNGDVLCGPLENKEECDSETVFEGFKRNLLYTAVNINGPYAFVFWNNETQQLWFGRDVFGRQSLLWNVSSKHIILSSVGHKGTDLSEVPALGIFMIDLSKNYQIEVECFPWAHLTIPVSSLSDVPVVERDKLVHCEVGDCSRRLSWLDQEPSEKDLDGYSNLLNFEDVLCESTISSRVDTFLNLLIKAVECRVNKQPGVCKDCAQKCIHCNVAVLFSGGIDSTIIALIADKFVPCESPIDLYNVAFQQKNNSFEVPDRITGLASLHELKLLAPNRTWNFIEVNVNKEELELQRAEVITDLIYPLTSVLDDSIGCALWFAAQGKGVLDNQLYTSPARVVLLGMGADEQLGGYTRHRSTLRYTGRWAALGRELVADTDNIGRRNLGRDNRVVSSHGRQPRTPFLDERVVGFINSLPPWHRCMPTSEWPPGVGDKLLLRLTAWHLGLHAAAKLPKRALQFGSRIANRKEKGNQISQRL